MNVIVSMTRQQLHAAWKCCGWHYCDQRYQGTLPDGWRYVLMCDAMLNAERDVALCPTHVEILRSGLKPLPKHLGCNVDGSPRASRFNR